MNISLLLQESRTVLSMDHVCCITVCLCVRVMLASQVLTAPYGSAQDPTALDMVSAVSTHVYVDVVYKSNSILS